MSFGLRRNTRLREDTLHNATEDGRYKAKQLQQERKVKEYKDTIEKLEKKSGFGNRKASTTRSTASPREAARGSFISKRCYK